MVNKKYLYIFGHLSGLCGDVVGETEVGFTELVF
ncbi:uncharacterized protein METZ01_LOCUS297022 [marine metagenome]|uniref:Uncharacterized protein n=1 Tax=marine metagenome TaxID=408172 RepID=A0A382M6C5_9ZZZZ